MIFFHSLMTDKTGKRYWRSKQFPRCHAEERSHIGLPDSRWHFDDGDSNADSAYQYIIICECIKDSGALIRPLVLVRWHTVVKSSGEPTTTETPRDNRRPSRFSSKFRLTSNQLLRETWQCRLRSGSGSVRSGTERATASISRPALRAFRPDSTSSASFSVSSSISTSTSSQRTPRRSLFGTTDRRRFFARRRLWKPSVVVYHASFNSQYKLVLLVEDHHCWRWWWWLSWWQEVILDIQLLSSV